MRTIGIGLVLAATSWLGVESVARVEAIPPPAQELAGRLYERLSALRAAEGAPEAPRRPELDRLAESRAREIAALPMSRRMAPDDSIEDRIRQAGIRRFRRAVARLALLDGFEDPAAEAVEEWRGAGGASLLDRSWSGVGTGVARGEDGVVVLVALFLEDDRIPTDLRGLERETERRVNEARREHGLAPLSTSRKLQAVARAHSEDMARSGYFSHRSPDGVGPADRFRARGIAYRKVAENIAENRGAEDTVAAAVEGWMRSPGHRANILDPEVTETGVGIAVDRDGSIFYTQLFRLPPPEEHKERDPGAR